MKLIKGIIYTCSRFCLLLLWSRDNVTLLNMWPVVLVRDSSSSQLDLACMTHTYRNCPHFAVSGARRSFQMNCPSSLHLGVMHGCHGSRRKSEDSKVRKKALFRRNSSASIIIQAQSFKRLYTFFGGKVGKKNIWTSSSQEIAWNSVYAADGNDTTNTYWGSMPRA